MTARTGLAVQVIDTCRDPRASETRIAVGDVVIAVRADDRVLAACDCFRAFAATAPPGVPAAATIHVVAGALDGRRFPSLPALTTDLADRPGEDDEVVTVLGGPSPAVYAATQDRREAAVWFADLAGRSWWERARPLLPAVQALLRDTPWTVLHAAAIGHDGRATLLTGDSHAGKTTLALTALLAGHHYYGDDVVAVALPANGGEPVRVARLYDTARLRLPALECVDRLVAEGTPSTEMGEDRAELALTDRLAGTPAIATVDRLLHVARAGAATPTFGAVTRARVIATVTATTLQVSFGDLRHRTVVSELCRLLPPRGFDPGPDPQEAVRALAGTA